MSARSDIAPEWFVAGPRVGAASPLAGAAPDGAPARPNVGSRWVPWIFAAKTTASGLIALLVAFAFNLDQPKWALLTVFIVAQPQSGPVLAKSFYRVIGTAVGAASALILVSLFAQERVLFLGTLAVWIGVCTYASKHARNFAAYGFVLAGYTVAIVGIPGALDPGNAFFIAVARITEISLGIVTTAAISHLILPVSVAGSLRRAVASGHVEICSYAVALLGGREASSLRGRLLRQAIAIETLRASAVFEDREIQQRSDILRHLDVAMLRVVDVGHLLGRSLEWPCCRGSIIGLRLDKAIAEAEGAIVLWRAGQIDPVGLKRSFARASVHLPLARDLYRDRSAADEDVMQGAAAIGRLYEFFAAFVAFAEAYEAFLSSRPQPLGSARVSVSSDRIDAVWAGIRASAALLLASTFWILTAWPSGVAAAILASVMTARLATMDRPLMAATGGTLVIALATVPSFILVEILLPDASGFAMFALAVAPMLFFFARLMAHPKTAGIGFIAALYFANVGGFQDHMTYDPMGFLNTSIALTLAAAIAARLFAIVSPDTPQAARHRFLRTARKAFERIAQRRPYINLVEFEIATAESLDQLCRALRPDRAQDLSTAEAGIALMGAGRELIRVRDGGRSTSAATEVERDVVQFLASSQRRHLERARDAAYGASAMCLAELRKDALGVTGARAAAREMVAFTAIRDELERGAEIVLDKREKGVPAHAA